MDRSEVEREAISHGKACASRREEEKAAKKDGRLNIYEGFNRNDRVFPFGDLFMATHDSFIGS